MSLDFLEPYPLSVNDAQARYGGRTIFSEVSFTLRPTEVFGLIGLNGVGKTTLIKTILDLAPLRSGSIRLFGHEHHRAESRMNLAYLPDRFQPSAALRGQEFLALSAGHFGQALDLDSAREMCESLGLDPAVLSRSIRTYSKGMGQKLALAATFLSERPLTILDEPMSGLDPQARVLLKRQLLAARSLGRCVFFSSHILADIEEICDRIGVFHGGRMLFVGTPGELVTRTGHANLEMAFLHAIGSAQAEELAA